VFFACAKSRRPAVNPGALLIRCDARRPRLARSIIRAHKVAVQLYAASLLAIGVDTEAERRYLRRPAHGLG
jgi:Protein of unknown function (DUF533)